MNNFFIVVLIGMITVGCNKFKPEEIPIDETENLVTYTAPNTSSVGIKKAGTESVLTDPIYTCIHSCFGCLIAEREPDADDQVTFDILDAVSAARLSDISYEGVMAVAEGFVMENAGDLYFLARGTTNPIGPKQQVLFRDSLVFTQSNEKWGICGITDDRYDKIAVIRRHNKSGFCLIVQEENVCSLIDEKGKTLRKELSPAIFTKLGKQAKKFADKKWGDDAVFGMTVTDDPATL